MELETESRCEIGVGVLLPGQGNVEPYGLGADVEGAAIRGLHAAGPAAGHDDEARIAGRTHQLSQFPADLVIARQLHASLGQTQGLCAGRVSGMRCRLVVGSGELAPGGLWLSEPGAAEHGDTAPDAVGGQGLLRLEVVELQARTPRGVRVQEVDVPVGLRIGRMLHDGAQARHGIGLLIRGLGPLPGQRLVALDWVCRLRHSGASGHTVFSSTGTDEGGWTSGRLSRDLMSRTACGEHDHGKQLVMHRGTSLLPTSLRAPEGKLPALLRASQGLAWICMRRPTVFRKLRCR